MTDTESDRDCAPGTSGSGDEMPVAIAGLVAELGKINETLHDMEERLEAVESANVGEPSQGFSQWLHVTLSRYYLDDEKDAIYSNTALLAEWQALYKAHRSAYGKRSGAFEQVTWHDALDRVLIRMDVHMSRRTGLAYGSEQAPDVDSGDAMPAEPSSMTW